MDASQLILKRQQNRYKMLKAVYEDGSNEYQPVDFSAIAKEQGLIREEMIDAERYLVGERLIRLFDDQYGVCLTHQGIVEVESSLAEPSKATAHFAPQVIQNVQNFYGVVGSVQNGSHNVANINQNMESINTELLQILNELRLCVQKASLSSEQQTKIMELTDGIEDEIKSPSSR